MPSDTVASSSGGLTAVVLASLSDTRNIIKDVPSTTSIDGDTVAGNFSAGDEDRDQARKVSGLQIIPWTGTGDYTEHTRPHEFFDWVEYLAFCNDGPKMRFICRDFNRTQKPAQVSYNVLEVSKKLWVDHSEYFRAMTSHKFQESAKHLVEVTFDDITKMEMLFLQRFIEAGPSAAGRPHIGSMSKALGRLARAYELADRFFIEDVRPKLVETAKRVIEFDASGPVTGWRATYLRDVDSNPDTEARKVYKAFHTDKFLDYNNAFNTCYSVPEFARVIEPQQLVLAVINHAPKILVARMCKDLDQIVSSSFKNHVFFHLAINRA